MSRRSFLLSFLIAHFLEAQAGSSGYPGYLFHDYFKEKEFCDERNPCKNGAECVMERRRRGFCDCSPLNDGTKFYHGDFCENVEPNPCNSDINPCKNGSRCMAYGPKKVGCDCWQLNNGPNRGPKFYYGDFCEKEEPNPCRGSNLNPCKNGGRCKKTEPKKIKCYCGRLRDFYGDRCQKDFRNLGVRFMGIVTDHTNDWHGILQLLINGTWGSICRDSLDVKAQKIVADIACKGFGRVPEYRTITHGAHYSAPTDGVIVQSINCKGNENSVLECERKMGTVCKGKSVRIACTIHF